MFKANLSHAIGGTTSARTHNRCQRPILSHHTAPRPCKVTRKACTLARASWRPRLSNVQANLWRRFPSSRTLLHPCCHAHWIDCHSDRVTLTRWKVDASADVLSEQALLELGPVPSATADGTTHSACCLDLQFLHLIGTLSGVGKCVAAFSASAAPTPLDVSDTSYLLICHYVFTRCAVVPQGVFTGKCYNQMHTTLRSFWPDPSSNHGRDIC